MMNIHKLSSFVNSSRTAAFMNIHSLNTVMNFPILTILHLHEMIMKKFKNYIHKSFTSKGISWIIHKLSHLLHFVLKNLKYDIQNDLHILYFNGRILRISMYVLQNSYALTITLERIVISKFNIVCKTSGNYIDTWSTHYL